MVNIKKGVRELIRVTMRERGIKHRSDPGHIRTVCFAEQARRTIEYEGPIFLSYEQRGVVHAIAFHSTETVKISQDHVRYSSWMRQSNGSSFSSRDFEEKFIVDEISIDIHDPKFCDVLGLFLDKHIKDKNKRPSKWKRRYRDTDQEYVFIPDSKPAKESRRLSLSGLLVAWFLRKWFKIDPYDYDYHWRHAVKRHFQCDDEELEQIEHTVKALQGIKHKEISANTDLILNNDWTEF